MMKNVNLIPLMILKINNINQIPNRIIRKRHKSNKMIRNLLIKVSRMI
jgi:hypothetical protein